MDRSRKPTDDQEVAEPTLLEQDFVIRKVLRKAPFTDCEPMNSSGDRSLSKGSVLDSQNGTSGVSSVVEASLPFGFLAMGRSGEFGTLATDQCGSLFGFGFLRGNLAKPRLPDLFAGFVRTDVFAIFRKKVGMAFFQMLGLAKTFKVFKPVVGFVMVDVMDLLVSIKAFHPALSHGTMKKPLVSQKQISVFGEFRCVKGKLSESFPATRNSKIGVKNSVFNSVDFKTVHCFVPFGDERISMLT